MAGCCAQRYLRHINLFFRGCLRGPARANIMQTEGTLIVDQCGDVRFCSTSLAQLLGQRSIDLAGRPVWSVLSGWTPYSQPAGDGEARLRTADGSKLLVQTACEILHVAGGRLFVIEIHGGAAPST
jgi:PAS domain-containing protein